MKMNKKLTLALTLAALPWLAQAHNLTVGQPVPAVSVVDKGELMLTDGSITYQLGVPHNFRAKSGSFRLWPVAPAPRKLTVR